MRGSRFAGVAALAVLLAGFMYGVVYLCLLRFEQGDVYPPYSSLRTDPLGTRVLYQSAERLGIPVERNFLPLKKIGSGRDSALLVFGVDEMSRKDSMLVYSAEAFEQFALDGGRVVITALPAIHLPDPKKKKGKDDEDEEDDDGRNEDRKDTDRKEAEKKKKDEIKKIMKGMVPSAPKKTSISQRWGVGLARAKILRVDDMPAEDAHLHDDVTAPLPSRISWHSTLYFTGLDTSWRVIYTRRKYPVVIEKSFGRGSIVLMSDSYLVSNQALRDERYLGLLAWLMGAGRRVIFDETHLGLAEQGGISALGRRYNLGGLVIALLILAGLFVWRYSVSFVPPFDEEEEQARRVLMTGKDFFEGFVNLIRKHVPVDSVLGLCHQQWKRAPGRHIGSDEKMRQVQETVEKENARERKDRDPVRAYNEIARTIGRRVHDGRRT